MGADGDDIAKLYADQMLQHLPQGGSEVFEDDGAGFYIPQGGICADHHGLLRFTDVVKAAGTQIDGRANLHICAL